MRLLRILGCLAVVSASTVQAQIATTDCLGGAAGSVHCTTMGAQHQYADQDWGAIFKFNHDRHVQKKLGQMISAGDCRGALNYALKESFELAQQVQQFCRSPVGR